MIRFRLNKICSILFYFRCSVIPKCIYELNKHAKTCAIHFFGKPTFVFNSSDFRPKIRRIFDEFSTNCQFDENFRRIFDKLSFRQNVTFDQSLHSTKWFSTKCHGSLFSCPQDVKEAAYKGLVRPVLEYGSSVWDPHTKCLQEELEKVQNRAARFVTRNYTFEEGSMTGILEQLKWESLKKRRTDNRLILLYKGLKGKARIPTDDLIPKTRRCRNSHSKAFQLPSASIEAYKCSFFPQTIRDWNDLPDSLFSTAEMSDDCVSKFALLVRSRD